MSSLTENHADVFWFVGAAYSGTNDQSKKFIDEGIWINGYKDKYHETVKSIKPGDRIAIKATYTRKHDVPFDNRGLTVSVMGIKAIGIVTENLEDGRNIRVNWTKLDNIREWYFYTNRLTIWRVLPGDWCTDALIKFAFENQPQDLAKFRNAPYWRERFGDKSDQKLRFRWTKFYEEIANKLVVFQHNRSALIKGIHEIAGNVDGLSNLQDHYKDGTTGPLRDICPFTVMGIFNRGVTDSNRKSIALALAKFLSVEEAVPESFEGIPILNNQQSWFFGFEERRQENDIDMLWEMFVEAIRFADSEDIDSQPTFIQSYDNTSQLLSVGWNLTMGLYWIRPWVYLTLDSQSRVYITKKLGIQIAMSGPKGRCSAKDYLKVLDTIEARFGEEAYPVHSFPDLSMAAWNYNDIGSPLPPDEPGTNGEIDETDSKIEPNKETSIEAYTINNILSEGCFIERNQLEFFLERLRTKKNVILQGPPGTGKTWLAKRLAYALIGQRSEGRIKAVQFHPNLSYEDFIRGWRPIGDGKLALVDGPFMEIVQAALTEPKFKHVIVIEEINRGNPTQIFGEMLTLLEADKRTPNEALELCYRSKVDERVFIPDNLYVIGTMNTADRSIAIVDFALRRRFAFIDLEPKFGVVWQEWVNLNFSIELDFLRIIENRILTLNEEIESDKNLGRQFRIGHSFFTPALGITISDQIQWLHQIVSTEIGPLLEEYWYDSLSTAQKAKDRLTEGF